MIYLIAKMKENGIKRVYKLVN